MNAVVDACALLAHRVSGDSCLVFLKFHQIALLLSGIMVANFRIRLSISRNQFLPLGV
jgi:hypothetical protein